MLQHHVIYLNHMYSLSISSSPVRYTELDISFGRVTYVFYMQMMGQLKRSENFTSPTLKNQVNLNVSNRNVSGKICEMLIYF